MSKMTVKETYISMKCNIIRQIGTYYFMAYFMVVCVTPYVT